MPEQDTMTTSNREQLLQSISNVNGQNFLSVAKDVFRYQAWNNELYARFLELIHVDPEHLLNKPDLNLQHFPCLPISLFKTQSIQSGHWEPALTFTSSGTTTSVNAQHLVRDPQWYLETARKGFAEFMGPAEHWCWLCLLPAYLEREGSSLVYMAEDFVSRSNYSQSGFYLQDLEALVDRIRECQTEQIPTMLLGVSFALLDLAEHSPVAIGEVKVMETGGMKGRRAELTRTELHDQLNAAFGTKQILSEYGMTELFSQAWSNGGGLFHPISTMSVWSRDITDPFSPSPVGKTGALNIIDLANLDTISFIATDDLARIHDSGEFEVLGRLDGADIRGCNLLIGDV